MIKDYCAKPVVFVFVSRPCCCSETAVLRWIDAMPTHVALVAFRVMVDGLVDPCLSFYGLIG